MNDNHIEAIEHLHAMERSAELEQKHAYRADFNDYEDTEADETIGTLLAKIERTAKKMKGQLSYREEPYHPILNPLGKHEEYTEDDFREDEQRANDLTDAKRDAG